MGRFESEARVFEVCGHEVRGNVTKKRVFVVYAYAEGCGQREDTWKRLFAGAETVESISDFDECERYHRLKRDGKLKTLGKPIRKDANRERKEKSEQNATSKKRKMCDFCAGLEREDCATGAVSGTEEHNPRAGEGEQGAEVHNPKAADGECGAAQAVT